MIKFLALILSIQAFAGTNNLPVETSRVIQRSHVNKFQEALGVDLVPRDIDGTVTDLGGQLGTTAYRWSLVDTKKLNLIQDAAGNAISVVSPASLASAYTITLPAALPAAIAPLKMSTTGVVTASGAYSVSSAVTSFTITNTATDVTNLTVNITTTGRPVLIFLQSSSAAGAGNEGVVTMPNTFLGYLSIFRDSTELAQYTYISFGGAQAYAPVSAVHFLDVPSAGTYTYKIKAYDGNNTSGTITKAKLVAVEL